MRAGKILGYGLGGLVVLVALVLLGVRLFVNPNDYRGKIAAEAKKATGRELLLPGDLSLSVFPWIALELGPASLGNPSGFTGPPFVAVQHASVRVKLLPLLAKRLEIGKVELDGLDVEMQKNAAGKGNWEGFGSADGAQPDQSAKKSGGMATQIAGIKISNARLRYEKILIENVSLETGSFAARNTVPVKLHLDAGRGVAGEHAALDLRFDLSADPAVEYYRLAALNLTTVVTQAGGQPLNLALTAPAVEADLARQTMSVPQFALNLDGAQVTGRLQGTSIVSALDLSGSIALAPLQLKEYLPKLGVTLPKTRDVKALSTLAVSTAFAYAQGGVRLEKLDATLDDTHLKGSFAVKLADEAMHFDLVVDKLDLDRYLPPPAPAGAPPPPPAHEAPATPSKPLIADGNLSVGAVHMAPLDLTQVRVSVSSHDKVLHIHPLTAQVNGGTYSGDITVDSRTTTPVLSLDEHLVGIDVGKLVEAESKKLRVVGRGTVDIKATGRGLGSEQVLKTLNGSFDLNVVNGAVEGVDLPFEIGRAASVIRREGLPNTTSSGRTAFDALKMSAQIQNGVAATRDLIISSKVLKVTGQGTVNLPEKTLDMGLVADTLQTVGARLQIPVKVTGAMTSPTVRPDIEALAKGQLKNKVQDLLQDKLKGLFH